MASNVRYSTKGPKTVTIPNAMANLAGMGHSHLQLFLNSMAQWFMHCVAGMAHNMANYVILAAQMAGNRHAIAAETVQLRKR
jgi:hypothetical protein